MFMAVSGKGGTGKTTVAALMVRHLIRRGRRPVMAVDADPNSTLADKLGVAVDRTIGDLREITSAAKYDAPAGTSKLRTLECEIQKAVVEGRGFDLLVMGRGEGPGCYCSVNNMLRQFLRDLASKYADVVIDNEAGMEHLSRRTDHKVDIMLVVSDDTPAALKSSRKIAEIARRLGVLRGRMGLVVNRVREGHPVTEAGELTGLEVVGTVPWDPVLEDWDRHGRSLLELPDDSAAVAALGRIVKTLEI
jgi:CO dehydrogenase maturation factor